MVPLRLAGGGASTEAGSKAGAQLRACGVRRLAFDEAEGYSAQAWGMWTWREARGVCMA